MMNDKIASISHNVVTAILVLSLLTVAWGYSHNEREYTLTRAVTMVTLMNGDSCANIEELINSPSDMIKPNMLHAMMDGVRVVAESNDCKFIVNGVENENK